MTLNELAQEFNANYMERRLRPSTVRGYLVNLNKHVLPYFGDIEVSSFTVDHLDRLTEILFRCLGAKSIVYVHATLRKMLNYAIRRGHIHSSPYDMFDLPRVKRFNYQVLSREQMTALLQCCKGTPLEIPVTMALFYGLRRGECLGIIPTLDLDYRSRTLHIQRTRSSEHGKTTVTPCKTENSDRRILLTQEHADLLRSHANGTEYACSILPHYLDKHFRQLLSDNNLPSIRFHDLRHSYATFMLSQGINPKIVSSVLGHSTVSITLDIYSHPDVSMQNACLQVMATI